MKNKIMKLLGVFVAMVTLVSLAVTGIPVSATSSVTDSPWTQASMPTVADNVLANYDWLGPMAIAKDGTIYAATSGSLGVPVSAHSPLVDETFYETTGAPLLKSTDGGHTWTQLSGLSGGSYISPMTTTSPPPDDEEVMKVPVAQKKVSATITGPGIFDVVCSSLDAKTVYVTDGYNIFKTVDAGVTWTTIASLFTSEGLTPGVDGYIVSIDIGYIGTNPYIFAGVSTFGNAGGGVYACQEAVYSSPWSNLNVDTDRSTPWTAGADVYKVKVDPNFATTQMVMAVASDYDTTPANNSVRVTVKYGGDKWAANVGDVSLYTASAVDLLNASIFLPSDFSSNASAGAMQAFIGVDPQDPDAVNGGVFLAYFGPGSSTVPAFSLNINSGAGMGVTSLAGSGTAANCKLLASGYLPANEDTPVVFSTSNSGQTWTENAKGPIGGASHFYDFLPSLQEVAISSLLVMPDYFTSGKALIGTADPPLVCNGISVTLDFGNTWNGYSLINCTIDKIDDLALVGSKVFMTTEDFSTSMAAVWRFDGTYWEMVFSSALDANLTPFAFVRASPAGDAIFVGNVDSSNSEIWRSTDNGQTWKALLTLVPDDIESIVATGPSSLVVGGTDAVYQTNTNGVVWFTRACAIGTITDIRVASNGDILAVGVNGGVVKAARSTDGGLTFTVNTVPAFASGIMTAFVAPAQDYATSGKIFVTGDSMSVPPDGIGIWSWTYGTSTAWTRTDAYAFSYSRVEEGVGLVTTPGGPGSADEGSGMVYATDGDYPSQVVRIRGELTVGESLPAPDSIEFSGLWVTPGSVAGNTKLWTIGYDGSVDSLYTYTDTLNVAGSGVAVSAVTSDSATVSWKALSGANAYVVILSPTPVTNLYATAPADAIFQFVTNLPDSTTSPTSFVFTGLPPVTQYYVSVWALNISEWGPFAPVTSFMFSNAPSFVTNPEVPTYPDSELVPNAGATNVPLLVNFQWDAVPGATSYELKIDTNLDMSTAKDYTGIAAPAGNSAGDFSLPSTDTLAYNTLYYWEVRAVTATGHSNWSGIWSFTTAMAPQAVVTVEPAPTPTVVITQQPAITITQQSVPTPIYTLPEPDITIQQASNSTPTYIWIIVGVGALLTLAVIVLIIRTRRVV